MIFFVTFVDGVDPDVHDFNAIMKLLFMIIELNNLDKINQIAGVVLILDSKYITARMLTYFTPNVLIKAVRCLMVRNVRERFNM